MPRGSISNTRKTSILSKKFDQTIKCIYTIYWKKKKITRAVNGSNERWDGTLFLPRFSKGGGGGKTEKYSFDLKMYTRALTLDHRFLIIIDRCQAFFIFEKF